MTMKTGERLAGGFSFSITSDFFLSHAFLKGYTVNSFLKCEYKRYQFSRLVYNPFYFSSFQKREKIVVVIRS